MLGSHDIRVKSGLGDLMIQTCSERLELLLHSHLYSYCAKQWRQDNSGGKGRQKVSTPTCCSQQDQLWGQTRFLRVLSGWSWKVPRMKTAQPLWATSSASWLSCSNLIAKQNWKLYLAPVVCIGRERKQVKILYGSGRYSVASRNLNPKDVFEILVYLQILSNIEVVRMPDLPRICHPLFANVSIWFNARRVPRK